MLKGQAEQMGFIESSQQPVIFSKQHDSHIRTAYKMFKARPIFGHGPKMFRIKCKNEKYAVCKCPCSTHPHNFYVW